MGATKRERTDWLVGALLFGATLAIFAQSARFDFVYYDDPLYTFRDDYVSRGLTVAGVRYALTTFTLSNWHPLTWLSYMLDVQLFGISAAAFHRTNVILHACSAATLYALLRTMTGSRWRSALATAIFALHPLRVESVAWIAERKDVLTVLLGLLTLLAYVRFARSRNTIAYLLTLILFGLCLLAKPMLVTLPVVMLLIDRWPLERFALVGARRLIIEKLPLFALSAASCVMTILAAGKTGAVVSVAKVSLESRIANAIVAYARYLLDLIWPAKLAVLYPFSQRIPMETTIVAMAVLMLISAAAVRLRSGAPHLLTGWLWYVITLLPAIGIVAVGEQARADRYTYFPIIGVILMIVWSLPEPRRAAQRGMLAAASIIVIVAMSLVTLRQLQSWRNTSTLVAQATSVIGPHATMNIALADALLDRGDWSAAAELYRAAQQLTPDSPAVAIGLGNAHYAAGRYDEALASYYRATQLNPNQPIAWLNFGMALMQSGNNAGAERAFRLSLRLRPHFAPAKQNLDEALRRQGKPPE